ncbi:MAG TPA: hypothetical protein VL551_29395 [Actinospica sp.]|jgi:hypothetical protein|nr:hypothetical protein [Actinospica sp.]
MDRRISPIPGGSRGAAASPMTGLDGRPSDSALQLLVETLLWIGLDLHTALEFCTWEPVSRLLWSAVDDVDEAVRWTQRSAFEHINGFGTAPNGVARTHES